MAHAVPATDEPSPLPPRIERLRDRALAGPDTPIGYRCLAHCEAVLARAGEPLILRRAEGLARTLETFPTVFAPEERLAGTHLFGERAGQESGFDFPEFSPGYWDAPGDRLRAALAKTDLTGEQQERILSLVGRSHLFQGEPWMPGRPEAVRLAEEASVFFGGGWCVNHSVRDYAKVLREGFEAIARAVDERLAALRPESPEDLRAWDFLRAGSRIAHAAAGLGRRYAEAARREAESAADPEWAAELRAMAAVCERVPAGPARSFREALQSLWFAHMVTCCEDHINANSLGRLDQILHPYYLADREAGLLTEEDAIELLLDLWLKLYRDYDVQQAGLGGLTPDGGDATNDLTYLCLEATRRFRLVRCLSVRLHARSPRRLLEASSELLMQGGGIPFFFNDDVVLDALTDKGIALEDARDYAAIGCVELTIPGKTNPHAVSHNTNLAKAFELALHDGFDPRTGKQIGPHTGAFESFSSAEEVCRAYEQQIEHFARLGVFVSNAGEMQQTHSFPLPYESLLTDDCLARGRDITEGGARYNYHSCAAAGIPNIADSLAALDRVVYGEGRVTPRELREALLGNFDEAEPLRRMLLHRSPKYGNDRAEADRWAARVAGHYCTTMAGHRTLYGGSFHVHLFSFLWHIDPFGKTTGALPDGRRAGEPLAYSLSPMQGRDQEGITAALRSLAQIPHHLAAASSSAILELNPAFFSTEGSIVFIGLVALAIAMGIGQLQFNVVSADRLRQAQADPERYGNLVVRVSGFSQRFASLSREMQDHIIERVKHER